MWLWISLCLALIVIEQNNIHAALDNQDKPKCVNNDVLIKLWTILADHLDVDGKTINVSSRDKIQYALTLIKKSIIEDNEIQNVDLKEKLFLREAELAKYKGVYLHDNRPLQTLLGLYPNDNSNVMFKYELTNNDRPNCREAFKELFETALLNYNMLANSPLCSAEPTLQSVTYRPYNYGYLNTAQTNPNIKDPTRSNDLMNLAATWNENNNVGVVQNVNPPVEPLFTNINDQNNILHAVKLSKDTQNLINHDFTADIEHAKNVADKMNAMYQSDRPTESSKISIYPNQALRELNTNFLNIKMQNYSQDTPLYPWPPLPNSYVAQNQVNPPSIGLNQSYTLITNTVQSHASGVPNTIVQPEYGKLINNFENGKYHPNVAHDNEVPILLSNTVITNAENTPQTNIPLNKKISFNLHSYPYQNKENETGVPQATNVEQYPYKIPTRTYSPALSGIRNYNYLGYNVYSHLTPGYTNILQNSYPYRPYNNPYNLKINSNNPYQYYTQASALPPSYLNNGYNKYIFQQPLVNQQNRNLYTYKYNQIPNTVISQKLITSISPQLPSHKVNMHTQPLKSFAYSGMSIQNNAAQFTPMTNYKGVISNGINNGQPVIDKLADWVSGTNAAKLNPTNDEAEIELTYLVKRPPPSYSQNTFYMKFRMPYKTFAKHISNFLTMQALRTGSSESDLFNNLVSEQNVTVIPPDTAIPAEDINNPEDKVLVRARYIESNEPGEDNAVDIINLVKEPEQNQANMENQGNLPMNNGQVPILRN